MSFEELVAHEINRDELASLIRKLVESLDSEPEEWENSTLRDFLLALAAWTSDMDGYFVNLGQASPAEPSWRLIGQMLLAARVYE